MSNMHPGDKVTPLEAGRLLKEQAARLSRRDLEYHLHRTSNEGLLQTFAALTHRLHAADHKHDPQAAALRSQRDRVQVEILRRMAGWQ